MAKWTIPPASMSKQARKREKKQLAALQRSGWRCHHCGRPLMLLSILGEDVYFWTSFEGRGALWPMTFDHLTPLSLQFGPRARDKSLTAGEVVASCSPCNNHPSRRPQSLPGGNIRYRGVVYRLDGNRWVPVSGDP